MDLQFCMEASFFRGSILNSSFFVNPFSSDAYRPTIHYNAGHNYIHTYIIVQELMNLQLCIEIGYLPRKISSLTLSVHVCTCTCTYIGTSVA